MPVSYVLFLYRVNMWLMVQLGCRVLISIVQMSSKFSDNIWRNWFCGRLKKVGQVENIVNVAQSVAEGSHTSRGILNMDMHLHLQHEIQLTPDLTPPYHKVAKIR